MVTFKRIVTLVLALLIGSVGCAPKLSPEELLSRAQAAMETGDLAAAEIDLKSVLRDDPENSQGRALYGQINMRVMNPVAAVEQFERSLASRENPDIRKSFAKALVQAGESAELVSEWEKGAFASVENEPQFQAALARGFLAQAQPDKARAALERAQDSPAPEDVYVDFTQVLIALQLDRDQQTARTLLEDIVERDPLHARAWSLLGLLATQSKDFAAAEGFYEKAAAANPYGVGDRIQLVETQVRLGKVDVASSNLSQLERQLRNYPAITFLRAQLLFDEGKYEDAIDLFNQILSTSPDNPGALLLAANANARVNKLAIARRHFERFLELQPGNVQATLQLAQTNALMGEPSETEALARALLEQESDNQTALSLLANALAAQGMHAESAQAFQRLTELQPDSTENLVALGSQQIVAGDIDAGLTQLEVAVDKDPDSALARERLIEARLVAGDLSGAGDAAAAYAASSPGSARAVVYLGRVRLQQSDKVAAQELFNRALELDPSSLSARGGLAALAMMDGDLESARSEFEKGLEANPGDLQSSLNLAIVLEQLGELDAMESTLRAAIKANPAATAPRVAVARKALSEGDAATVIELLAIEEVAQQNDFRALQTLTGAYLLVEQTELALATAEQLLEQRPDDPSALAIAARANSVAKNFAEAESLVERALKAAPESTVLRKQYIETLVAQNKLELAATEIDALPTSVAGEVPVLVLRGRIALASDDVDGAIASFAKAFDEAPLPGTLSLLSAARWMNGERGDVIDDLESWLLANPDDMLIRGDLAARQIELGDESAARANYLKIVKIQSENIVALNNLAWLLRKEQPDEALTYIKIADRLAPDSSSIKDTYAMVELERGEFDRALALNQRALDAAPGSQDLRLNRARILLAANRSVEAKRILGGVIEGNDGALKDEALQLLQSF